MTDKNNNSNLNPNNLSNSKQQNSSFSATHENKIADKYKNVEPLPESSRPRRDGPGGEDGE